MPGSLILIYHGLEEENLNQKSPGPPGWGLMQWASPSLIAKKQEMLKNQTPSLGNGCMMWIKIGHQCLSLILNSHE
jgi:hypothetical protein